MDLLQKFKRDLLNAKYGTELTDKVLIPKKDLYLKEAKNLREKGDGVTETAELLLENKLPLTEENYTEILGFHLGDGWTVAHELAYQNQLDMEKEKWPENVIKEVLQYTTKEGLSVKDVIEGNYEENKKEEQ